MSANRPPKPGNLSFITAKRVIVSQRQLIWSIPVMGSILIWVKCPSHQPIELLPWVCPFGAQKRCCQLGVVVGRERILSSCRFNKRPARTALLIGQWRPCDFFLLDVVSTSIILVHPMVGWAVGIPYVTEFGCSVVTTLDSVLFFRKP